MSICCCPQLFVFSAGAIRERLGLAWLSILVMQGMLYGRAQGLLDCGQPVLPVCVHSSQQEQTMLKTTPNSPQERQSAFSRQLSPSLAALQLPFPT